MLCIGYEDLDVAAVAVGLAAIPAGSVKAMVMPERDCGWMKFRMDGTAPTAAEGADLGPGDILKLLWSPFRKRALTRTPDLPATLVD